MYGLTFKGIHSSIFNTTLLSDNRQVLSDVVRYTKFIPQYGNVDFGNDTYNEKTISVGLTYCADTLEIMQSQMELIGGWLYNDGLYHDLIFDDAPQRKYRAKVTSKVNLSQGDLIGELSVEFTCNPPYPFSLDNSPVSPSDVQARLLWDTASLEGTQYIQNFSSNGNMQFTVSGTLPVKPKIKIIGNIKNGLTLTYGSEIWKYNADIVYDGIIIDCASQTVTKMSNGSNLIPNVDINNYAFFNLGIGQQLIGVSGTIGIFPDNLAIAVEFSPQYGG